MQRYFKLVCLDDPKWLVSEFDSGRLHFGWSAPGSDLRQIRATPRGDRSPEAAITWRYSKFLIERIGVGDRVVVQYERPLKSFVVGEVITPGYDFLPGTRKDFNHVLHVKPLIAAPVPINAMAVPPFLRHDLSKRGQYYEIYPERSLVALDRLVEIAAAGTLDITVKRTDDATREEALRHIRENIACTLGDMWPRKHFEKLCEIICKGLDNVEVKDRSDSGDGWDLRIRIANPITGTILLDNVPVQCKNFSGDVEATDTRPIDDLERCIRNSPESSLALLFILGKLTKAFRSAVDERQEKLTRELGRQITFDIVDQDRIAELYALAWARDSAGVTDG